MTPGAAGNSANPKDASLIASSAMAHWSDALVSVIETMIGHHSKIESQISPRNSPAENFSWWGQSLSILDQPSFWIGASAESWTELGRLTLCSLGVEDPTEADIDSTCRDLLAQTTATVAAALASQSGEVVSSGDCTPDSQPSPDGAVVFTWSLDAGLVSLQGSAVWGQAFLSHFSGLTPQSVETDTGSDARSHDSGGETLMVGGSAAPIPKLELRVKFVLGRATMSLADVFKLNVGSVIELDRTAIEPADVVIHGRMLAHGQVVVVNGNYGLKIVPPAQ